MVAAGETIPAKKKLSGCAIVGIIGGVVSVLLALLVAVIYAVITMASSGAADATRTHLALLKNGDVQSAYEGTANGFRSATSLKQYRKFLQEYPQLTDVASSSFGDRKVENGTARLSGTLTNSAGQESPIQVLLVKEGEEWKILSIDLTSPTPSTTSGRSGN